VPSICTKVGGTDLFVKDGENGFLVNSNSEQDLKEKLEYILQMSDEEILTMKKNAYMFAQQNFDISVYVDKMKKFLESCV
jgi:glycosyltransferase involved in cell wall biosynthesis